MIRLRDLAQRAIKIHPAKMKRGAVELIAFPRMEFRSITRLVESAMRPLFSWRSSSSRQ